MKRLLTIMLLTLSAASAYAAGLENIVPAPAKAELLKGSFKISGASFRCDPAIGSQAIEAVARFAADVTFVSGKTCPVSSPMGLKAVVDSETAKGVIFLKDSSLKPESYNISIGSKCAVIRVNDYNGTLYAIQTLKQLLPETIYGSKLATDQKYVLPCCNIEDSPRFAYRGMHLDCSRHFWSTDEVKRYLDVMEMFKLNRFHWHLTDDQGWRVEIKRYPLLSQIACYREGTMIGHDFDSNDHKRYGGFYSQEEIKEIVEYAAERGITIVPEIDLPGHMLAAMSAYPWLGCTGGPYEAWTKWGVADQVLCAGKETTYEFLENVLSEIADMFPGEYIHIGGDECPKDEWETCPDCQAKIKELGIVGDEKFTAGQYLQNYVTSRMQKFLLTKGKKIIGWDEILEGNLEEGATVMSWRGVKGGQEAAAKGFDTIMTPTDFVYFDYCQAKENDLEPLNIGGYLPIETVYSFDPLEGISPDKQSYIKGVQANLWTEYIDTPEQLEYMLLPRMLALCEVQWCTPENRDFARFSSALTGHEFKVLDNAGYTYSKVILGIHGYGK